MIYILTLIIIGILNIIIHKTEKKQNLFVWINITFMFILCFNIFICTIFSFIYIKCNLLNLTIINSVVILIYLIKILKDKKIQKYYIKKADFIYGIILLLIVGIIAITQYEFPFKIKYYITDGSTHYYGALDFYNNSTLLSNKSTENFKMLPVSNLMPGAYINVGLIFKCFSKIINQIYFINIYIIFDLAMLYLSGTIFYCTIKKEKNNILTYVFPILYMLGYQLNSIISGFQYLHFGLNIILGIFLMIKQIEKNEGINENYLNIVIGLLSYGVFFTYYYFMPVVYLAMFMHMLIKYNILSNKKPYIDFKKICDINNILKFTFRLFIPALFGTMYFVLKKIIENGNTDVGGLGIEGDIYSNLFSNIIIFMILAIGGIIYLIKKRDKQIYNFEYINFALIIAFMIIIFIGKCTNKVSNYYFYKLYYFVWISLLLVAYETLLIIYNNWKYGKICINIGSILYVLIGIIIIVKSDYSNSIYDIYGENCKRIKDNSCLIESDELKLLDYYYTNLPKLEDNIFLFEIGIDNRAIWLYSITNDGYLYLKATCPREKNEIEEFIQSDDKYGIIFYRDYEGDRNFENYNLKVLTSNDAGAVVKKQ